MNARIEAVLEAVATRLGGAHGDLAVERYAGKPEQYLLTHAEGALLVMFNGSSYQPSQSASVAQPRRLKVGVVVVQRTVTGANGALARVDGVLDSLVGHAPAGCGRLMAAGERFLHAADGVWWFGVDLECEALLTAD
ncbi:Gp37 family protein [Chitiniphilus shinanonensis]|uniref:Gp37 family protein n=1 Tax=Chitiniphilus shinanonensis TaxID=553088 RepID=UPI0030444E1F